MLLFADEAPESGLGTDPTGSDFGYKKFLKNFEGALEQSFNPERYQSFFVKLEDQAVKTSRSLASNIAGYSKSLENTMFNVYKQTVKIGGSTKDVIDYAEAFATQTGRVPMIQEEVIVNAVKISKEFGISTKEVAAMAGEFTKVGLSQMAAVKMIRTIGETSRKYGVNASQLTKVVQENVKKSSAYTFKDGVEGLTKMAAKAQSMGVSFDSAFDMYDKFLDPDKAIEFASQMQMLGGDVAAQFGDPYRVMSMSVEEINEGLKKSVSSQMEFNAETGRYQATREGQKYIRLIAEQTGESVENLTTMNVRTATLNDMLKDTKFNLDVSDEDKEILASRAQKMGGTWKVQIPTLDKFGNTIGTELKDVSKLTSDEIKKLGESEKEKSVEEVNKSMLSIAEQQNATLQQIRDAIILRGGLDTGKASAETIKSLGIVFSESIKTITNTIKPEKFAEIYKLINEDTKDYIESNTGLRQTLSKVQEGISDSIEEIKKSATYRTNPKTTIEDGFFPGSGSAPKIMSEGKIYEGIVNDQVAVGPNLDNAFEMSKEQFNTMKVLANAFGVSVDDLKDPFKMIGAVNKSNPTLQNTLGEKPTKLSEVMTNSTTNTNINTTNTQNLSGGFTITIDASKVPNSLDPTMLKNEMMKVMYQLSDEMKKQGVLNFKLK